MGIHGYDARWSRLSLSLSLSCLFIMMHPCIHIHPFPLVAFTSSHLYLLDNRRSPPPPSTINARQSINHITSHHITSCTKQDQEQEQEQIPPSLPPSLPPFHSQDIGITYLAACELSLSVWHVWHACMHAFEARSIPGRYLTTSRSVLWKGVGSMEWRWEVRMYVRWVGR